MQRDHLKVGLTALVGGLLLGSLDFVWIKWMPYPFAELGNSTATWALAAFLYGYWLRTGWTRAAIGASVLLVIAVPAYYVTATLIQSDELSVAWSPTSLLWMVFGVLASVVFGIGGTLAREPGWRHIVGTALPAAVFFEEAARFVGRLDDPSYEPGSGWNVMIDVALGILAVVLVGRSNRNRALALAAALPLAALIYLAFALVS
ncbi:hypothetical protein HDA40_002450 [Hamadaea flava]|uniref:DUF6518 family protein n=1 Tax=Hamadaea flava TaxID=1742688 RepID=A0ABV8LKI0_9ACTN|nr:DUF6518 family protein [Hamadaea flava]MCP2323943.1 hypothetical protein [Hamadaea flava]